MKNPPKRVLGRARFLGVSTDRQQVPCGAHVVLVRNREVVAPRRFPKPMHHEARGEVLRRLVPERAKVGVNPSLAEKDSSHLRSDPAILGTALCSQEPDRTRGRRLFDLPEFCGGGCVNHYVNPLVQLVQHANDFGDVCPNRFPLLPANVQGWHIRTVRVDDPIVLFKADVNHRCFSHLPAPCKSAVPCLGHDTVFDSSIADSFVAQSPY